jgi:hypothetical protein
MYVVRPIEIETFIEGVPVAIQFRLDIMQLDPRESDQYVTTCYLRPMDGGPKRVLVGVAVCHPKDKLDDDFGRRLALARAIQSVWPSTPGWTGKQAWRLARRTIREWRKEQQARERLEAVREELGRLKATKVATTGTAALEEKAQELEAAGSMVAAELLKATKVARAVELPAGPVSQFLSK